MSYIIYGAGGHAKVIIDILHANHEMIIGVVDDYFKAKEFKGIPVLGKSEDIKRIVKDYPDARFLVAIGNNNIRMNIVKQLEYFNIKWGTAIHPSAIIGSEVTIGEGTVMMPNVVVNADSVIGKHTILNTATTVDHDCSIADYVHLSPGVHTAGGVSIGERTHIGIAASLIPGVHVGKDTIVGASSCVLSDLPDEIVAVGCPAKMIKNLKDKG
ncbi:acetyltransferase [Paenibacillus kyungheensis]|uniref:Acetyltransferase n=1 Tax=Paenibacillus kyungheensis TaxID=1452732 RepID=A0AAX3LZD5_9BACL|nr:acetyltransferase [Paenibacillus kyungheensis]WCT55359.1 acetyltransferase [Paenibacillus kyungheensis]